MTDRVGEELGKYRLTRLLGRGSFAEVYLGEHVYLKTEAAVKVLRTHLAENDVESFLNEAQTIARLVHPNIIRIFDFDVQEGTPFLVMDYAPNGTLRQRYLRGISIPLRTVVYYVRQLADALQYAHNLKFIHRDVKPENMLLGRRDEVLLSDFGIVQVVQSTLTENEGTQKIEGTIAYMSPEQLRGKARFATDQYALGIVVYEWLSGNRPFQGSLSEMASQHLFVPPPPLREKVPTIPPAVEEVVMMALAKDPKQRFANVQAFATALEQAAPVTPTFSYGDTSPYTPSPPIQFTTPPTLPAVNEPSQGQQQLPPQPQPTVIASPGGRPLISQQPPVIPTTSVSSSAGMPVFTDPPAQVQQQLPTLALPVPSTYQTIGPGRPGGQQGKNKVGRNALLIVLAIVLIASVAYGATRFFPHAPPTPTATATPFLPSGIGAAIAPDGEYLGISDGTFAFDIKRPDGLLKSQAVDKLKKHDSSGVALLQQAVRQETNDAEALIYLEDQRVMSGSAPYVTLIVGTSLTGKSVSAGRDSLQGAYVVQKEFNSSSKLPGGVQVRLLIANSGSTDIYAPLVAKQIVQLAQMDKTIVGVMGWPTSTSTRTAIAVLAAAHVPMITPTAFFDSLTAVSPYLFRITPSDMRQAAAGVKYAEQTLHATKAALFFDPADSYSREVAMDFEQQFVADRNIIVAKEMYTVGHPEMLPKLLRDTLNHNPDLIYFSGYAVDGSKMLADLPTSGPFAHLPVLGPNRLDGIYPGSAFNHLHFTELVNTGTWDYLGLTAKKPAFFTEYQQDFDPQKQHNNVVGYSRADGNTIFSYDAMLALLSGCRIAFSGLSGGKKMPSSSDLQQALTKMTGSQAIQGVSGQISFGSDGNVINKAIVLLALNPQGEPKIEQVLGSFLVGS